MEKYINANIVFSKFCNYYANLKKDLPIRPSEMGVLNIIVKREGRFTPLMIAELLEVSKPMVTAHIVKLEKSGYIKREQNEDRRSFFVLPTAKAIELVNETTKKMNVMLSRLEGLLGKEDFEALLKLLIKTNENLKEIKGE